MYTYKEIKDINMEKVKEFYCNYATWSVKDNDDDWKTIIDKSSCIVTCWDNEKIIGMCRSLSDEVRWATIVDVLVHPDYRNQSVGNNIIKKLLDMKEMNVRTIYLATADKEEFYIKLGFKSVKNNCSYMVKVNEEQDGQYYIPIKL